MKNVKISTENKTSIDYSVDLLAAHFLVSDTSSVRAGVTVTRVGPVLPLGSLDHGAAEKVLLARDLI